MAKKKESAPSAKATGPINDNEKPADLATAVENAIAKVQGELGQASCKVSIADLIRLLQLRKELSDTRPKTVTVRWIEEWNETSSEE